MKSSWLGKGNEFGPTLRRMNHNGLKSSLCMRIDVYISITLHIPEVSIFEDFIYDLPKDMLNDSQDWLAKNLVI